MIRNPNLLNHLFELSSILVSVVAGGEKDIFSALGPKLLLYFHK